MAETKQVEWMWSREFRFLGRHLTVCLLRAWWVEEQSRTYSLDIVWR